MTDSSGDDPFDFSDVPDLVAAWPCQAGICGPEAHEGLTVRGAYALWVGTQLLADEWRDLLGDLKGQDRPALDRLFADLPPLARRLATSSWLERFVDCFDDLADGIVTGSLELACTGEEVAFQILLRRCAAMLADEALDVPPDWSQWPDHGQEFDFDLERIETLVCQDIDVCWLWQPELDGIEDGDDPVAKLMRSANLHPRDWFTPFATASRIPAPGPALPPLN
jgi:hypothetical protein